MQSVSGQQKRSWMVWGIHRWWGTPAAARTIEDAVRHYRPARALPTFFSSFRVLGTRRWNETDIVVYHVSEYTLAGTRQEWLGYSVVRSTSSGWQHVANMGGEYAYRGESSDLLIALHGSTKYTDPQHTIVLGRVRHPGVARVEVVSAPGHVLEAIPTDGLFLVAMVEAIAITEVRLFDHADTLIARHQYNARSAM